MSGDDAIPAATLVAVRDKAGQAPELLMVERAEGMAFAGGALVFPGGRIDQADRDHAAAIGSPGQAAEVAAIRETVEETAVPVALGPQPARDLALDLQRALLEERSFAGLLRDVRLSLDLPLLVPLARWVPKFHAARRFDTLFFLAPAPGGDWPPNTIAGECAGAEWLTAAEALDRDRDGRARLIFPTRRNLERLAQFGSFAEMAADAAAHPIAPITPWVEEVGGEQFVTIAEGIGYPVTRERLDELWRG